MTTRTREKCPQTGRWRGDDEHRTIEHCYEGREMPPCAHCHREVTYTYIGPLS